MKALMPFFVRVFTSLLAIVSNYYVAKVLGVENFGIYFGMLTITFTLGLFSDWGLSVYGSQLLATVEDKNKFISEALQLKVWLCLVCSIFYLAFCLFQKNGFWLMMTGLPIVILSFLNPEWIARGLQKPDIAALRQLLFSVFNFASFFVIYKSSLPQSFIFFAYSVNTLLSFFLIYIYLKKYFTFNFSLFYFPLNALKKTSFYFAGYLLNNLVYTSGAIMLTLLNLKVVLGTYSSYYNIFATVIAPVAISYGLFAPKVQAISSKVFYSTYLKLFLFMIICGILFYFNGAFFYHIFYPKSFLFDSSLNYLTLVMFILYCFENIFVVNSILIQNPKKYLYKNIVGFTSIILSWIVLSQFLQISTSNIFVTLIIAQSLMIAIGLFQNYKLLNHLALKDVFLFIIIIGIIIISKLVFVGLLHIIVMLIVFLFCTYNIITVVKKLY